MPFFQGRATYADKLFKVRNGRFEDLLSDDANVQRGVANHMAGRSVACVDRKVLHLIVCFINYYIICCVLVHFISVFLLL